MILALSYICVSTGKLSWGSQWIVVVQRPRWLAWINQGERWQDAIDVSDGSS